MTSAKARVRAPLGLGLGLRLGLRLGLKLGVLTLRLGLGVVFMSSESDTQCHGKSHVTSTIFTVMHPNVSTSASDMTRAYSTQGT